MPALGLGAGTSFGPRSPAARDHMSHPLTKANRGYPVCLPLQLTTQADEAHSAEDAVIAATLNKTWYHV